MQAVVGDVMSREIQTISRTISVYEALRLLVHRGVEELYVTDAEQRLIGILPDYELLKHQLSEPSDPQVTVERLMSRRFLVVAPATPLGVALRYLRESFHRRLAVVEGMQVVGQISRIDVLRELASQPVKTSWMPPAPRFLRQSGSPTPDVAHHLAGQSQ